MKKKILYITITAALLLSGCTKEDESVPDTGSSTIFESLTESIHDESTVPDNSSVPASEKEVIGVVRDSDGNEWKTYKKITDNRYYDVVGYMGTNSRYVILQPNPIGNGGYHLCDLETNEVKTILNRNTLDAAYDWNYFDMQLTNEYIIIRRSSLETEDAEKVEDVVFDIDLKPVNKLPYGILLYTHDLKNRIDQDGYGNYETPADCTLYIEDLNGENRRKLCKLPYNTVFDLNFAFSDEKFIYGALVEFPKEKAGPCAVDIDTGELYVYDKSYEYDQAGVIYTSENYLLYSMKFYRPDAKASEPAYLVVFDKTKREFYEIGDTISPSEGRHAALTPDGTKTVTLAVFFNREGDVTERTMRIYDTASGKLLKSVVPENGGTLCCTNEKIYLLGNKNNTIYTFEELGL